MNVLSLFGGVETGLQALKELSIPVNNYYSSEIDPYAIAITKYNHPEVKHLGNITKWRDWGIDWGSINLITGGPPCQAFSVAGKQLAFDDPRGMMTKIYFDIVKKAKPKHILMENVLGIISVNQGEVFKYVLNEFNNSGYAVDFIEINSSLVSAQNRKRIYLIGKRLDICQGLEYNVEITKEFINDRKSRRNV